MKLEPEVRLGLLTVLLLTVVALLVMTLAARRTPSACLIMIHQSNREHVTLLEGAFRYEDGLPICERAIDKKTTHRA